MIEHIKTPQQRFLLTSVLLRKTVILSKNQNGYHVIQKCLEHFPFDDTKHLIKEIAESFLDIAMDKSGCCVLNQALDCAQGELKEHLLLKTIANAVFLSENPFGEENASMIIEEFIHSPYFVNICRDNFGNYVVQKALEVSKGGIRNALVSRINDSYPDLHSDINAKRVVRKARDSRHRI
ncbi:hypothetical protein OIU84_025225 [Salix udensis]|uniref:PUM-HD domain-containing protein n=1 Tax=Salix udensis TaxID=889485 RepID=A0AAD6KLB4_9ROSI|nr:hypothetical protein OIU84_025225 [Salix udensis]